MSPNGELQARVTDANGNPVTGNFSYEWYPAEHLNDPEYLLGTASGISYLIAGTYAVAVTDIGSGCAREGQAVVPDLTPKVEMNVTVIKDYTNSCDGTSSGGQLSIEVISEDGSQNIATRWYSGSVVDPAEEVLGWKNMLFTDQLPAGTFTIQSTNNNTGCKSAPYIVTIREVGDPPLVTGTINPNTSCLEPQANGSIGLSISASAEEPANGYTVEWFYGQGITGTLVGEEKKLGYGLEGMMAGYNTVQVANPETQCQSIVTFLIPDMPPVIGLMPSTEPNTVCDPELAAGGSYTGAISAQLMMNGVIITDLSDFQLQWFRVNGEEDIPLTLNGTTSQVQLQEGEYKIEAIHQGSGCTSGAVMVVVGFTGSDPALTSETTHLSSCDAMHPNGSVSFQTNGSASDFTFTLYQGAEVLESAVVGQGQTISNLSAGQYLVVARNNNTGCSFGPLAVEIRDESHLPLVEGTLSPNTTCDGLQANGGIALSISEAPSNHEPANGYSVEWFYGQGVGGTPVEAEKKVGYGLGALPAGTYTAQVTNPETQCQSIATFAIEDRLLIPELQVFAVEANTICDPEQAAGGSYTGAIELRLSVDGQIVTDLSDFQLQWFVLDGEEESLVATNTSLRLEQLQEGNYSVRITHLPGACVSVPLMVPVGAVTRDPGLSAETTPVSSCDPLFPNGSVAIQANGSSSDFTFVLYKDTEAMESAIVGQGEEVQGLSAGQYLVIGTNKVTGCQSRESFTISTEYSFPAAPVTSGAEGCEAAGLSLSVEGNGTHNWYQQATGGAAFHTGNILSEDFSETTTYYVTAINEWGCESAERSPVTALIHELPQPLIEAEGNRLFTTLEETYTYHWYLNDELLAEESGYSLTAAQAGEYRVEIISSANCSRRSEPYAFAISALQSEYSDGAIALYPNPFYHRLTIELKRNAPAITGIRLLNQQMKQLLELNVPGNQVVTILELSDLPQGMYILEIRQGEQLSYRRIVRQ